MGGFTSLNLMGRPFEAPDPEPQRDQQQQQQPQGAQPPPEKPEKDERTDSLEREVAELRTSNRQLLDLFRGNGQPRTETPAPDDDVDIDWGKDEDPEEDEDEPEDPAALVEDLSKLGRDALAKRGFVRKAEVVKIVREESRKAAKTAATQVVSHARTEVGRESVVIREFPDLADAESELYKATAAHVRAAVKLDPAAAKNPVTLYLAAKAAQAELKGKGGDGTPANRRTADRGGEEFFEDDEEDDREPILRSPPSRTERDIHIASQSGDRGRKESRTGRDGGEFVMSDQSRDVARQMGLTDQEFSKEATRIRKAAGSGRRR